MLPGSLNRFLLASLQLPLAGIRPCFFEIHRLKSHKETLKILKRRESRSPRDEKKFSQTNIANSSFSTIKKSKALKSLDPLRLQSAFELLDTTSKYLLSLKRLSASALDPNFSSWRFKKEQKFLRFVSLLQVKKLHISLFAGMCKHTESSMIRLRCISYQYLLFKESQLLERSVVISGG